MFSEESSPLRIFLERFPQNERSYVASLFYQAVRAGYTELNQIIQYVKNNARGRYAHLPDVIAASRLEAEDFARYALLREKIPKATRDADKVAKNDYYREQYLKSIPATPKQLDYLRDLGYPDEASNRWEASKLIDYYKNLKEQ